MYLLAAASPTRQLEAAILIATGKSGGAVCRELILLLRGKEERRRL